MKHSMRSMKCENGWMTKHTIRILHSDKKDVVNYGHNNNMKLAPNGDQGEHLEFVDKSSAEF